MRQGQQVVASRFHAGASYTFRDAAAAALDVAYPSPVAAAVPAVAAAHAPVVLSPLAEVFVSAVRSRRTCAPALPPSHPLSPPSPGPSNRPATRAPG